MDINVPKSKKAAKEAGLRTEAEWWRKWSLPKRGEQPTIVKGTEYWDRHQVEGVVSVTGAKSMHLKVQSGVEPCGSKRHSFNGTSATFNVYRVSDLSLSNHRKIVPPAQEIDLLRAIFAVNKSAKRYRDAASSCYQHEKHGLAKAAKVKKERLYKLKDRGIGLAYMQGRLVCVAMAGGMAVYRGDGYCFHSTLLPVGLNLSHVNDDVIFVESAPKTSNEARLMDSIYTLEHLPEDYDGFTRLTTPRIIQDRQTQWEDWDEDYVDDNDGEEFNND